MFFFKKKNEYSLLPHISDNVYGFTTSSPQNMGWEITKFGIEKIWSKSAGDGVIVAVVDTGCDLDHPDIKNNILQGRNFINKKKDPSDDNGHGTHVSGTIAAENNSTGIVGVAPKAKILPVKALDSNGTGNQRAISEGIVWSADNKADFICMSLGSSKKSDKIEQAIKYAVNKGCIVFCAAGNSGPDTPIMYPAKLPETIAIGAIDKNLQRTNFTCSGPELDFLSPGHEILSCVPDNNYAIMSGTSMATPYAVGCAALLLSYNRRNNKKLNISLKNKQDYINFLKLTSIHLTDPRYKDKKEFEGYGIIKLLLN